MLLLLFNYLKCKQFILKMILLFFPRGKKMVNFHLNRSSTVRALGPVDSFAEQTVFSILCYSHLGFISWVISFYIHCISKKNYLGIMFFKFNKNTVCDPKHIRRGHFRVKGTHRLYFFFFAHTCCFVQHEHAIILWILHTPSVTTVLPFHG